MKSNQTKTFGNWWELRSESQDEQSQTLEVLQGMTLEALNCTAPRGSCLGRNQSGLMCFYKSYNRSFRDMNPLPPIIFLHGLATSGQRTWGVNGWLDLVTEANRSAIIIDMPGHGDAYNNVQNATFEKTISYILDQFPDTPIDAVGFSLGARILLTIASQNSSRFRKLVVSGVGENLFTRDYERGKRISEAISGQNQLEDPESQYFSQLADAPDVNRETVLQLMSSPMIDLNTDMISKIECPVLVALGDRDFAGPASRLVEALPYGTYLELRGVDHFATPKDFSFIDATLKFLDAEPKW